MGKSLETETVKDSLPEGSILDAEVHARLIEDITTISRQANVPIQFIHKSMKEYCNKKEIEWFAEFHQHMRKGIAGVLFEGINGVSIDTKMMAITGAFLRNFVDARIVTLTALLQSISEHETPDPTVLLIPNFYVGLDGGKPLSGWQVSLLHDVLMERFVSARATILFVSSFENLQAHYGQAMALFLKQHWKVF